MSIPCPVRCVRRVVACILRACVWGGKGRKVEPEPQGEIPNVTLVLGQLKMAAAEKEGKEGCGDQMPMPVI